MLCKGTTRYSGCCLLFYYYYPLLSIIVGVNVVLILRCAVSSWILTHQHHHHHHHHHQQQFTQRSSRTITTIRVNSNHQQDTVHQIIDDNCDGNHHKDIQWNAFPNDDEDAASTLEMVDRLLAYCETLERTQCDIFEDFLQRVDEQHRVDFEKAKQAPLVILNNDHLETMANTKHTIIPPYEWVPSRELPLAARTLQPILSQTETDLIRKEAECLFRKKKSSRFTYQFQGNSEAHVTDFQNPNVIAIINRVLTEQIEPWIRHVFFQEQDPPVGPLFVYDALVIRYNATASQASMAGQPLHRDLGSVSINIMLNEGFEGGGTFFDDQLQQQSALMVSMKNATVSFLEISKPELLENQVQIDPIKPLGVGYALAHRSSQRHAGAGTTQGVRDILVIFVATQHPQWMRNARLKQCRSFCENEACSSYFQHEHQQCSLLCRIRHHRLAIDADPNDGEAYQYLGTALMELSAFGADAERNTITNTSRKSLEILKVTIACFCAAQKLTPCDSRVYNNLAIAFRRFEQLTNTTRSREIELAYHQGFVLLQQSMKAGCNVVQDFDSLCLNYGLYLANQDKFSEAYEILAFPARKFNVTGETHSKLIDDAHGLYKFCESRMGDMSSQSRILV